MNRIWISTDWHLYSYDNDSRHPFRNARNLGKLAQNFAEEISEDDLFLFLGDLCDPRVSDTNNIKNILGTIDGYKVICRGNHDTEEDDYYIDLGFDAVTEITRIHNMLFSHKPIRVLPEEINIHGHLHTEKLVTSGHQHINAYGTNWNTTDKPILLEELLTAAVHQVVELPKREENHITEKFEKYTSFENDVYTKILDLSDEFSLAPMDEATNSQVFQELNSMNTPNELYDWMRKNIRYANFTRLKSQAQMIKSRSGSCHDQVAFAYPILRAMENVNPRILFFIATNPDKGTSGQTHSLIWWSDPADKKVYWFENSWGGNQGIHKFDSEEDMKAIIEKRYKEGPEAKNYPELVFKSTSIKKFKEGITLGDLVNDVYHGTDANEVATPSIVGDAIDEILFPDVEAARYWLADDESYRKKAEKAEEKAKDTAGIAMDESVKYHSQPMYFVSNSNKNDELYPIGKCIFSDMDAAINNTAMDIKHRYPDENVFPLELYVHQLEPGYYELRVSDEVCGAYWSMDKINLECIGKVIATSPDKWSFDNINETVSSFNEIKRIVNNIPKEEHHWFYHGETFKDSPYVKYRKVMYLPHVRGKVGGFIDVYTFSREPETGIIVIAVEPAARGTGLSQKLVQKAIDDAPSLGIKKLIWRADTDNIASIKLAQKMGFADISDLKKNPDQYKYEMALNEAAKSSLKVNTSLYFISKDRLDEAASNSSKSHVYTEPLYRITYNDIGIYEAYKKACSFDEWRSFINSDAATWLDVPKIYNKDINHTSYFTKRGYELFQKNTYPVIIQKLNKRNIKVDQVVLDVKPVYEDLYQVVVPNSVNESSIQDSYQFELLDKSVHFYDKIDEAASYQAKGKLYEKFGFKLKKTFNSNGENGYEKGRFRWYQLDESAGVINEMAYEDYCDCFYAKLKSLAAQYNKRDDIFKHVAKVLKMEQKDLPKFDCHIQVSGEKQLCFSLVNSDTSFEIRCEYEKYLKEMIEDLEKDVDIKTKCPHIKSIWTADAEGTIYVNLDYEHINEAIADTHSLDREQKKRIADKYGLRDVGNSHEEEEVEAKREKQKQKERELDEKRKKRLKQLEKARAKQKRDRFFKSMKSKIPGVKNEDADTVDASEAEYLDDLMCEYDNVRGEQKRVFDDPRRYADAALDESAYKFEMVDKIQFFDRVDEAAFKAGSVPKLYPVYIMLMHSGTVLANAIKTLTQSQFSHSSISFDSTMKSMYSFGRKTDINPFIGGFKKENINDKFFKERNIPYALYVVPCTEDEINRMKKRLDYFTTHATKFKYDFTGLFKNYFGIADNPEYKWYCSRFVADILNFGRPSSDPYIVEPSLMKPEDFTNTTFATYVTGGFLSNYDQKTVDTITKRIIRAERIKRSKIKTVEDELVESVYDLYPENPWSRVILECQLSLMDESTVDEFIQYLKSFKIRFNKNGDIVVTRREYDQLDSHFRNSLKMIKAYEKSGNLTGVKDELCKIHYMIELINRYYLRNDVKNLKANAREVRKDMLDLRSVMLNVFQQHLRYATTHEPKWNFQQYYDNSKYGKNTTIPQSVISSIGKAVITALS